MQKKYLVQKALIFISYYIRVSSSSSSVIQFLIRFHLNFQLIWYAPNTSFILRYFPVRVREATL